MKSRKPDEEIGTEISISGSEIEYQSPVSCAAGTNILVRNLFFNVPARRKFLKSNQTELKHIINEFQHIALAHPEITFSLSNNDTVIFQLPEGNIKQRIMHLFGKQMQSNLTPLHSKTSLITITGFIGKPEHAKKTTGEQFFFINGRFMRHPYFHRAVMRSYEKLLPQDTYPSYFLYFDSDPGSIDVNIHPTKTEIKFENEQAIFQILQAAIREALGKSNLIPSIDFNNEGIIDIPVLKRDTRINVPQIEVDREYNPFRHDSTDETGLRLYKNKPLPDAWEALYNNSESEEIPAGIATIFPPEDGDETQSRSDYIQLKNRYILTTVKSGIMVIDQKLAYERIFYEQLIRSVAHNQGLSQMQLYPARMDLDTEHYLLIIEIKDDLALMGIDISDLGKNTVVVNSCPAGVECQDLKELIEALLEEYKNTEQKVGASATKTVAASLAKTVSTSFEKKLFAEEMQQLVDELFACENPNYTPAGKRILSILRTEELEKYLK